MFLVTFKNTYQHVKVQCYWTPSEDLQEASLTVGVSDWSWKNKTKKETVFELSWINMAVCYRITHWQLWKPRTAAGINPVCNHVHKYQSVLETDGRCLWTSSTALHKPAGVYGSRSKKASKNPFCSSIGQHLEMLVTTAMNVQKHQLQLLQR